MLNVNIGDQLSFDMTWEYQGPKYDYARARVSIGDKSLGLIFNEKLYYDTGLIMPAAASWTEFNQRLSLTITDKLVLGKDYNVQVKIYEGVGPAENIYVFWQKDNAVHVIDTGGGDVEFRNLSVVLGKE